LKKLKTNCLTPVSKSTIASVIQQQEKRRDEWTLCHGKQGTSKKKWKHKTKDLDAEEALN
jgi:hypothetical protein